MSQSFPTHEILEFHARGLIDTERAREMLGLTETAKPAAAQQPAFESDRARERFKACLRDCGVVTAPDGPGA